MGYLSIEQIAEKLDLSYEATRRKIYKYGIRKSKTKNRKALYFTDAVKVLYENKVQYYPLKTTVTYHIYESKMNYE